MQLRYKEPPGLWRTWKHKLPESKALFQPLRSYAACRLCSQGLSAPCSSPACCADFCCRTQLCHSHSASDSQSSLSLVKPLRRRVWWTDPYRSWVLPVNFRQPWLWGLRVAFCQPCTSESCLRASPQLWISGVTCVDWNLAWWVMGRYSGAGRLLHVYEKTTGCHMEQMLRRLEEEVWPVIDSLE